MSRRTTIVAALLVVLLVPSWSEAGRGRGKGRGGKRSGPARTVNGPVYNPTLSPEYRLWASNPTAYRQMMALRQQQALAQQQHALLRQQQAFLRWVKTQEQRKEKGLSTDPAYDRIVAAQRRQEAPARPSSTPPAERRPPASSESTDPDR